MNKLLQIPIREWKDNIINKIINSLNSVIEYVKELLSDKFTTEIVQTLPDEGDPNKLYLILSEESEEGNYYDEYLWINNNWDKIGNTKIETNSKYLIDEEEYYIINNKLGTKFIQSYNTDDKKQIDVFNPSKQRIISIKENDTVQFFRPGDSSNPILKINNREDIGLQLFYINTKNNLFNINNNSFTFKYFDSNKLISTDSNILKLFAHGANFSSICLFEDHTKIADPVGDATTINLYEDRASIDVNGYTAFDATSNYIKLKRPGENIDVFRVDNDTLLIRHPSSAESNLIIDENHFVLRDWTKKILTSNENGIYYKDHNGEDFITVKNDYTEIYNPYTRRLIGEINKDSINIYNTNGENVIEINNNDIIIRNNDHNILELYNTNEVNLNFAEGTNGINLYHYTDTNNNIIREMTLRADKFYFNDIEFDPTQGGLIVKNHELYSIIDEIPIIYQDYIEEFDEHVLAIGNLLDNNLTINMRSNEFNLKTNQIEIDSDNINIFKRFNDLNHLRNIIEINEDISIYKEYHNNDIIKKNGLIIGKYNNIEEVKLQYYCVDDEYNVIGVYKSGVFIKVRETTLYLDQTKLQKLITLLS